MALEPTQVNLQVQHFSHLIKDLAIPLDRYTKPPPSGNMYSLSAQLKQLKTFEKRNECPVEEATSGESSPCQSDSEIETRSLMPDLQDVTNVLTEELSLEIDESLERLRDFNGKGISFVFENFDYHFRTHRLSGYIKDIRVSGCHSDKILSTRNIKEIVFAGSSSYHVEFSVRRPELLYEFILRLQEYLRNETRRPIKIVRVLGDRRKRGQWNAVIIRNLQPRVTQKELETQCKREVVGPISVGTIVKIKDRFCCIVRCDHMEDAEAICKRLNNFLLKDAQTHEKYYFKAHLHPQSSLKHFSKEKSIFSDYLKSSEKAGPKAPSKTGINDLLDMFQKSKKPASAAVPEKPKTHKEPSDKTQNGPTTGTGTDMLIKSISSSEIREAGAETSGLSMLIKSTSSIEMTTSVETLVKSHSQKETKPAAIQEEVVAVAKPPQQDTSKENTQQENKGLVITKAEDKNKRSRSKSPQGYRKSYRYDERSSHYQNKKSNAYDDKKYEKRTKRSKSKSSNSRSRSKSKSASRRYKTEKPHKHRNGTETKRDSPHKSRSKERKRHHRRSKSKSRSKSHSKSRSHSKHRHHNKSSPGRKKPLFEYKVNNSDSEKSRSPSKKIKKSRSKSKDRDRHNRYKNDYKTTSSYKSQYRDRRDDRGYNDHHKSSYSRRDRSGSRHRDSYNTDRKDNYHYKGKDDYYERRKKDYDYDKDHRKGRRRSRSKGSRSKDKRSRSKSASHSRDRKRNSSTGRNGHRSTSRDRKTSHKPELKIEKTEGNKHEVATAKN